MSKKLILKICEEVVNGKDFRKEGFGCTGVKCRECPFDIREEDGNLGCCDRTSEETIKIAQKYIAKNTEEKEMKNKFKVGDRVKKINGDLFGQFRNRPHKVVTIEKIDDYLIWFKETGTNLDLCDIDEIEKVTENKTKITFKEFVNEAEEGKIYVSESGAEFYKDYDKIIIDLPAEVQRIKIPDDAILTLKKQEYTFAEAIEKARKGNIIISLVSEEYYTPSEIEKSIFELNEIEGKWNVEE